MRVLVLLVATAALSALGVRYRLQESGLLPTPTEALSLTLSLKAQF